MESEKDVKFSSPSRPGRTCGETKENTSESSEGPTRDMIPKECYTIEE